MIIECPADTRLQEYLLKNDIHILTPAEDAAIVQSVR